MSLIKIKPIGHVRSSRKTPYDDEWDSEESSIALSDEYSEEALYGLSDFTHVEVVFYMDKVKEEKIELRARHPRNKENWPKVGIFSQRGKNRPNQLGLTICRILKIEGSSVFLEGLDAIDGTPVLDIKPWVNEFGPRGNVSQPSWITELMREYWTK